jgi:dihydroflavonol-4-reductase
MVVVTGATGHIGNVLVRELSTRNEKIRAVIPFGEDTTAIKDVDLEIVRGDVRDIELLKQAIEGADIVYHLAGIISILPGKRWLLQEVNVKGTRNVVEACLKSRVKRLVYVSSIHAIKEPPRGTVIDETQPFDPSSVLGDYAKSKAQATLEVLEGVRKGLDAVIVCPTGVIGPYDFKGSDMGQLILSYIHNKMKACIDGAYDFVDVRDVAKGIVLAAEKGKKGQSYILSGERISVPGLFSMLEKITGIRAPKFKVPCQLARVIGIVATPYYLLTKSKPLITKDSIDVLASNSYISSQKAKHELGYTSRPIWESLVDSVTWFKQGILKSINSGSPQDVIKPA